MKTSKTKLTLSEAIRFREQLQPLLPNYHITAQWMQEMGQWAVVGWSEDGKWCCVIDPSPEILGDASKIARHMDTALKRTLVVNK